jgi:hypothetical protein
MREDVRITIDRAVKEIWLYDIAGDYEKHYLLKEDTLKNSFYFHLRRRLGERFLEYNKLRIFTEFNDGELKGRGFRADIAIVSINPDFIGYWGDDPANKIVALFELKYTRNVNALYSDIEKTKNYIRELKIADCLFYLGFIEENQYPNRRWLDARQTKNWANGKVTVLSASFEGDKIWFDIQSCNGLNADLDVSGDWE